MSNNYHEQTDSFNLSKEDIMNCFGSQIASESSKSKHDYENEYNPPNEENASLLNPPLQNIDSSNGLNKDAILSVVRSSGNLDGKIILMHSIYSTTADAVEVMVPELINQGYQLVTISEMAYYKGVALNPGQKYYSF